MQEYQDRQSPGRMLAHAELRTEPFGNRSWYKQQGFGRKQHCWASQQWHPHARGNDKTAGMLSELWFANCVLSTGAMLFLKMA
jgi:hypothetical protein